MTRTTIEWTDESWNPVTGCDHISPGCDHCYADAIATRFVGTKAFPTGFKVTLHPERLDQPLHWRKPRRVFVNSMSDLFHPDIPDQYIADVFDVMLQAEQHTFQVLTKRPQRMQHLLTQWTAEGGFEDARNVWLGTSIESDSYTFRARHLRLTPARVRFLSVEPLLGPLGPPHKLLGLIEQVDWVIVGGESGPAARPMDPDWVRAIRDACVFRGVPFFFKQWGGRNKKAAGRDLDGRTWDEMPA